MGRVICGAARGGRAFRATIVLIAAAGSVVFSTKSHADQSIGGAETVVNEVHGRLASGNAVVLVQGDGVYSNEMVRTNTDSSAKLVLRDSTSLSVGPSSSVKLDRFVYSGAGQPGKIALNLVKGAFVFATGNAEKQAYSIVTPTAALGVRGTILKISATEMKTVVQLVEGAVTVCMRSQNWRCVEITAANATATVTTTNVTTSQSASSSAPASGNGMTIAAPHVVAPHPAPPAPAPAPAVHGDPGHPKGH